MKKLLVCGSRSIIDKKKVFEIITDFIIDNDFEPDLIISGKATGVDSIAADYGKGVGIKVKECPAKWDDLSVPNCRIKTNKFGKKYNSLAGFIRNHEMVDFLGPNDMVLAITTGSSGTQDTIDYAKSKNIQVVEYLWKP